MKQNNNNYSKQTKKLKRKYNVYTKCSNNVAATVVVVVIAAAVTVQSQSAHNK